MADSSSETVTFNQVGCARCDGEGHDDITFTKLTFPFEPEGAGAWTHWASCPTNGEPILLRFEKDDS